MIVWQIDCVNVWSHDGKPDVVDAVFYSVEHTGGAQTAKHSARIAVPYDPNAPYVPLDSLTEAQMVNWVKGVLNGTITPPAAAALTATQTIELSLLRQATMRTVTPLAVLNRLNG